MARGNPISVDLRQRAVDAYENGEGTYQEIADRFCIGRTTLCDLVRLSRYANTLEPLKGRRRTDRRIDVAGRERLLALVLASPDATIAELTDAYNVDAANSPRRPFVLVAAIAGRKMRVARFRAFELPPDRREGDPLGPETL